jgi:phosphoribosylformylglycinamidine synthase
MIIELDVIPKDYKGLRNEFVLLGKTTDTKNIEIDGVTILLDEATQAWESALDNVFPTINSPPVIIDVSPTIQNQTSTPCPSSPKESSSNLTQATAQPKVLIPIFPGSTDEYELEKQFRFAGAEVNTILFRTLSAKDIEDSYSGLTEAINNADILAIPSGMSAGAEPDGSSKLITLILRHPNVKKAINKLISERKGLILGTGEGFKALLKTGLIQTGQIQDVEQGDIILTKHPSNNYYCTLKTVKAEENTKSPWLKDMAGELETVPISGKDIVVHMSEKLYNEYLKKGQIATRYIDKQVEAMTSENGQVLGRTGLVENLRRGLYTNVFEAKESKIFKNAVDYIKNLNENRHD